MDRRRPTALLVIFALGGCAQVGELRYETNCAQAKPEEARSRLVRDLCQKFGTRGSVQIERSGQTLSCGPGGTPTSEELVRMFIESNRPPSFTHGGSSAYIYLRPAFGGIMIEMRPPDDLELLKEVSRAVESSFGSSGCTWVVHQRQYTDTGKLG
jgi:hypothetical protein